MKVAFHFNAFHPSLGSNYGNNVEKLLFRIILSYRSLNLSSKVLTGDLLLSNLAYEVEKISERKETRKFSQKKYSEIVKLWLQPENTIWSSMSINKLMQALNGEIFTICFETIEMCLADYLDDQLREISEAYIGAMEVDDASYLHWWVYSNSIGLRYRINNKTASVFWDGISEDSKDESIIERLTQFGFKCVSFESLNGRYTIFDEYHDFDHARRVAEWKKHCSHLLAFIADGIAHRLGDATPDLGDKLWAALKTFNEAETNEEFAQVTASCRRIVEYISDELFPPIEGEVEGHKLGSKDYRNRLLAFVGDTRKSDTNIDLIWVSAKTLSEQMEKLSKLANKGVHADVYRGETRRCLLRTIMLLDDIISLKTGSFEIKTKLNLDDFLGEIL
ncbi:MULTISPECIES: hypothetical protein [unclassified Nodularia (in: cyanobacteria)]|uniref:hypothetical protein n=1 Tax=unclassified Nodularia (in: cyanobacteria) TaxID=2656917 RepID=UPI00187FB964|nr:MULTISPECIES: hypothetical protein [unclassified Nodularia (in: cyanobacteria)]MBE9199629.1 hypothetical protein [Nodularia sp. LEGE 06071]MCC2695729.1 hypothetical protein [Nodularia sp. LEGE 04288]